MVVLGSILRNSHKDYVKVRLEHTLREAINTYALTLLHLHNLQDRYHIMHKSSCKRERKLISIVRRNCLTIPTRHVEGELSLGSALARIEGSSHFGDRAPS